MSVSFPLDVVRRAFVVEALAKVRLFIQGSDGAYYRPDAGWAGYLA